MTTTPQGLFGPITKPKICTEEKIKNTICKNLTILVLALKMYTATTQWNLLQLCISSHFARLFVEKIY